jgi:hypothetical protein
VKTAAAIGVAIAVGALAFVLFLHARPEQGTCAAGMVRLSNIDDQETLFVDGKAMGTAGFGQPSAISLGELCSIRHIRVEVYNRSLGYAWGIELFSNGKRIFRDVRGQAGVQGANHDDLTRQNQIVHTVVLDSDGHVLTRS